MRKTIVFAAAVLMAAPLVAQEKSASAQDACTLIPSASVAKVQGAKFVTTKASTHDAGTLTSSACYFKLEPDSQSVSLEVLSKSKGDTGNPKEFWESKFDKEEKDAEADGDAKEEKSERRAEGEEEREHGKPPQKIAGLGDEAFWVDTGRDGALYVLAGDRILRLSLGGSAKQEEKKQRAVELVRAALKGSH